MVGEVDGLQGVAFLPLELVFSGGRGGWATGCGVPAPRAGVQWWERWMGFRVWRLCPLELVFSDGRGGWASGCGVPAPRAGFQWWERWMGFRVWRSCP